MKSRYDSLYDFMASSREQKNMEAFGHVMTEMMDYLIQTKPDVAEEMIDKLESIRWKQYLTQREAETIIENMVPKAPWKREVWLQAMAKLGLQTEEQPYYNRCALWAEMNKQYSDHGGSVAELLGTTLTAIPVETIVPAMYHMAIDLLRDKDGVYDIRKYFSLA